MSAAAETPTVKRSKDGRIIFEPDGVELIRYLLDRAPVSIIQGPVGSGKSKGSNIKVMAIAHEQVPDPRDGIRRTRWAVVRNTYPDLKRSTIRTWLDTFPENEYGTFKWSVPYYHRIRYADVEIEADFLALDKPDDVKKLRSAEYTGFYVNELQYIPKELFDEMTSRAGRYPAVKDGGATWSGVIADMNAPEEDHWLPPMLGQVPYPDGMEESEKLVFPSEWRYFLQPPGLTEVLSPDGKSILYYEDNPLAENKRWLKPGYYLDQIKGKTRSWIDSRVMNRIAVELEGSPVWPGFRREMHVSSDVRFMSNHRLFVGLDFGRTPAAVIGQHINHKVQVHAELLGFDEGATTFAPKLKAFLTQRFPGANVEFYGDPKGADKGQADERTAYDVFAYHGMKVQPAPVKGNAIQTRIEAVEYVLNGLYDGLPRFRVSPVCRTLVMGMLGKYHFKRNDEQKIEPAKNSYSHVCDALQYMVLGMGEGRAMIGLTGAHAPQPYIPPRSGWSRGSSRRIVR